VEGLCCVCECGGSGNKLILFIYPFMEMLWNRDVNLGIAQSMRQNWGYLFVWKQLLKHPPWVIKAQCGFTLPFIDEVQLDFAILLTNLTESMRRYIFRNSLVSLLCTKKNCSNGYPFLVFPCRFCHRVVFMKQVTNTLLLSTTVRR